MPSPGLPAAVTEYYETSARGDTDGLAECFTEDATVFDESREWRGRDGVRDWRSTVTSAFQYTTEIREFTIGERQGRQLVEVVVHLEGNFPGGEVDLVNSFELRDGRIYVLRTGG